ncbi:class I SAM-dependent methyltransferase [Edwardsiella ictaluri]|uniref:Methyltransferase domain protein n=2 Tax=Edwardsiella ictaluri TaxID=67780 RepID=C5BEV6_EDWI9|nr:methyltransferase domain-containing protein [Edwardsiella ictaluri]ACR70344.2 Methyltransferase domain protein [Edwardsiella ictaluri 93-146]ARD39268.1 SAM-dependent methyltransferase [Edwardsiella ictaluri]AVZ82796.1 class I SAM-dependent methyltransferase [Edwardsiella ictaluri]EKS7762540.1 class I SAM-dependent methyltransferase [Edwardsiella ictaluri]EKS7770490.1 class I SAM-dependent methyltransferase [Edwardsiella ictaluri]
MRPALSMRTLNAPFTWRQIPWGLHYRAALELRLTPWWPKLFGYHLLKLGTLSTDLATDRCTISHQVSVAPEGEHLQVIAEPAHLPFAAKSVDACLLAHTLGYSHDPHRVLREVDRVLVDDGWLIISGFSPLSLLGMGKLVPGLRRRLPYSSRMFSMGRLIDWLNLLNYEVLAASRFQVLPWHNPCVSLLSRHFPAMGCLMLIVARKRTVPLTLTPQRVLLAHHSIRRALGSAAKIRRRPV